jgi:DNA polymerase III subunit beta
MKFTVDKKEIMEALSGLQGITGRKSTLAITENVLIRANSGNITLSATDLETGFEGVYPASVEHDGIIAVNARRLNEIVRTSPTDQLKFEELENRWIEITSGNAEFHLVGMNAEEFPDIPKIADVDFFRINSEYFKSMVEKSIIISVAGDEKREHMIGVLFERIANENEKIIRMVSTDIKRLAKIDYVCESSVEVTPAEKIIIPKKGLTEVNKFLETHGDVLIGVKGNHFIVKKENETIITNLLDGDFPDINDLMIFDKSDDIEFDKDLLLMTLRRMLIVTSDEYRAVIFKFANNELTLRAVNPNVGESKEALSIQYQREPMETAFNPKYFIEAINFIEDEKVLVNIKDKENPGIVRGMNDSIYLNIIMPMKI